MPTKRRKKGKELRNKKLHVVKSVCEIVVYSSGPARPSRAGVLVYTHVNGIHEGTAAGAALYTVCSQTPLRIPRTFETATTNGGRGAENFRERVTRREVSSGGEKNAAEEGEEEGDVPETPRLAQRAAGACRHDGY